MYAKKRDDFEHIDKLYSHRIETWTLYSRRERNLATRGFNTKSYCEASMKITKDKQLSRIRTFNLPEMLQVICDDFAIYVTKRVDISNGRDTVLKQSNSRYLDKESKITKELIGDLGDYTYLVESENEENKWYSCNNMSGYCPVGSTCAPCKQKTHWKSIFL